MCIDEKKNFVWQDVPEPVCHDEFDVKLKVEACAVNRADVWPAFEARKFVPYIHKVLPITEATEAHAILERGENRGKVVLMV